MVFDERIHDLHMRGATRSARNVESDANNLAYYVSQLTYRLPFETVAEHGMERAERALESALIRVRQSRADYASRKEHMPHEDWSETARLLSLDAAE